MWDRLVPVIGPNVTVTLITRTVTGRDQYGNDQYGETSTTVGGVFAPGGSSELVQGQDTVISKPTVYLPAGTGVSAVDAIVVGGLRYTVDGQPADWTAGSPFTGWVPQFPVVVQLQRVTG